MSIENMFSVNIDSDSVMDHEELIIRKESEALSKKRKELDNRLGKDILKSVKKSVFSSLLPLIPMLLGMMLCAIALREEGKVAPLPFALAGVLLVVAVALIARNKKKAKAGDDDGILDSIDNEYGALNELVKKELGVPEDAREIEIFADIYSEEDKDADKIYTNDTAFVFKEDDKLCFLYGSVVVGFSTSCIKELVRVDDPVDFEEWMKDVPYDRGSYMQYKIQKMGTNEYDEYYSMNGYYSLRFTCADAELEVMIPLYDIEPITDILKIKPINE